MLMLHLVTTDAAQGVKTNNKQFKTIDEALQGADGLLNDGAPSVWIVDSEGNLVMPADQVRVRLNLTSGVTRPPE